LTETHPAGFHPIAVHAEIYDARRQVRSIAKSNVEQLPSPKWHVPVKFLRSFYAKGDVEGVGLQWRDDPLSRTVRRMAPIDSTAISKTAGGTITEEVEIQCRISDIRTHKCFLS